jgi:hypothetical protein
MPVCQSLQKLILLPLSTLNPVARTQTESSKIAFRCKAVANPRPPQSGRVWRIDAKIVAICWDWAVIIGLGVRAIRQDGNMMPYMIGCKPLAKKTSGG